MKKILGFVALFATLTLTSCEDVARCWLVSYNVGGVTIEAYHWSSKADLEAIAQLDKIGNYTYKAANKSESDCIGLKD